MKILYCIETIFNSGGLERIICDKTNYLIDKGYEIHIVVIFGYTEKIFFNFNPKTKFHFLNLPFKNIRGLKKKLNFIKNQNIFLDKINQILENVKPDISISVFENYSQYLFKAKNTGKLVIERHFSKYKSSQYYAKLDKYLLGKPLSYIYKRSEYNIIKHYDKFVVLTKQDKELWGDLKNIEVIGNFSNVKKVETDTQRSKTVVALGRFENQKNFSELIKIWNLIHKNFTKWNLNIYGDGKRLTEINNLISKYNLEKSTHIYPPTRSVDKVLSSSSIYVMTSKYEGLPLVLIEAMQCGLPIIAYDCKCGPKEIISEGKDGFLINPGDRKNFANKLSLLMGNYELRTKMGENALEGIKKFSKENIMNKWENIFRELVKKDN